MDNKTFKKMLLGMAMASPLALINSGNVHASSVKTNVETNWHATVQQELRNQNINPDYKITNAKYIVQAGDTLSQIAAATHINMYHIAAVNHIQNLNLIYVGQVLILNQGNEVAHNVAGNGSTTADSIGNTYTLRSTSQQPVLNYYGHTQSQGTTGTSNVQRTANVNSKGTPTAEKPAKAIIPSTPSANNNNQNVKPATPTVNTGSHTGNTAGSTVTGNTIPSVSGSVNTGSHVAGNTSTNTGSTVTPNTQGSASQTGSSATQNNNSQKTPTVDSSSASQQAPAQSSSSQGSVSSSSQQTTASSSSAQQPASSVSHATTSNAGSNTQQPASSASSASQPTGSSQAQGSVNTGSTATPSNSQKTPTVDSSSASSNTQQPAQSSSSQGSVSSSSQQTTASSSSAQQPASSASSSSQSTASTNSSSQSSASSSSQSSASSSSQKTVDGYTLDNMPLSVFNDKKNLNAINNTFSGDAIENYFNNHIGKGNMTWDEAQQAQQNGTITSAILSWNGQMLPTEIKGNTYGQAIQNSTTNVNWNNSLPLSYLRNDSQEAQINNKYGNISNETNESQTQYVLEIVNNYRKSQGLSEATTDSALQQKAQERLNTLTSFSHSGMVTDDEALEEMEVTPNNEFDLMNQGYQSIVDMLLDDADSNWGHRNTLLHDKQFACAYKVVNGQGIIVIVANK